MKLKWHKMLIIITFFILWLLPPRCFQRRVFFFFLFSIWVKLFPSRSHTYLYVYGISREKSSLGKKRKKRAMNKRRGGKENINDLSFGCSMRDEMWVWATESVKTWDIALSTTARSHRTWHSTSIAEGKFSFKKKFSLSILKKKLDKLDRSAERWNSHKALVIRPLLDRSRCWMW